MIKQLEESMNFDVMDESYYKVPKNRGGAVWLIDRIESAERNIAYHTKHYEEEVERTNSRNKWIADLYISLN